MLHAESRVRLLECQDEIPIEPCSKKMKSAEGAYEKLSEDDNQCIQDEVDPDRTSNDLTPVYVSESQGEHEVQKQEEIPMGVLGTPNEVLPENNLQLSQPLDSEIVENINPPFVSINNTKVEEEKDPLTSNNVDEDNIKSSSKTFSLNRSEWDDEFITSKEFIGPIYKPAECNKQDKSGSCGECRSSVGDQGELHENRDKRKEAKSMETVSSAVPEMDDELNQFYKEIHQLESENLNTFQEKETETSQEQYSAYNCSQTSQEDHQRLSLGSPRPFNENGQCFSGEEQSQKTSSEQQCVIETGGWKHEKAFNGQIDSEYWNSSVPEFRPAWQSAESFIVPQGLLPPRLNHQSHFQILNSLPQKTNAFPSQHDDFSYENYCGYHGSDDTNCHSPLPDPSASYVGHTDIHSAQVFRNGNNEQKGPQNNGFCETREECWKDPKMYSVEGVHRFSSSQFPEERFGCAQKVLLILRGLPGSGKSTLSRILLGESCDGIVLSTDDYFRQQDGYMYNVVQLGDAHDWNQKRAKQAMEQGRSPVIIDNTNTQAWEMKPYVEVALEKGYRVEFHEPDTWWKFDPEELEKGIILKKNHGHPLTKAKQRKKRRRSNKMKGNHTEIMKKKLGGATHLIPDDQETSGSEEDDSEEENRKSLSTFGEGLGDPVTGCEEQTKDDHESLKELARFSKEGSPITVPEISAVSSSALENELPVESDSSLLIDVKPFCTVNLIKNAFDFEETNQRHDENLCKSSSLKIKNDKNSIQKPKCNCEDNGLLSSTENELKITCKPDMEAKLLCLNGEKREITLCSSSKLSYDVPDSNTDNKSALKTEENCSNGWAFFSINLSTEELQQGFDTQVSLSSWSENETVGEQRQKKVRKPKQIYTNSSTELNCHQSNEGLVKENHQVPLTEEVGNVISNGLLASPAGEMHMGSLGESRNTSPRGLSEVNVPKNDVAPVASRRKRRRRIVNLAPKFNVPREIAGSTERGKEVPLKDDGPSKSVLEVEQKSFLNQDCGEEHEQNLEFPEYSAPYSGPEAPCSMLTPGVDSLLQDISYIHLGQSSPMPKYSCSVCVISRTEEEQARTVRQQQVADEKKSENEQASSEVTNKQPDILSSLKVLFEYPEDPCVLESCVENVHRTDDPEPSEAFPPEDTQDVKMKTSFLGLPLSIGFAFQLVQLFGSPGLPLESLLPDDYVVPLDWKVSKMIYLLWKTSVEEKQKTSGLQNGNALADNIISLEDLNKNCQENENTSETLPETELLQGLIEENITSYASSSGLDAVLPQS
ncbi:NEDD4-binding protein 2-like 2 isoform X2 [Cygnus atratus]|uniref:NEDD4-binding protein 2-like 2 isoform X2 n=1 Tax=Cygnus atratus TaxID=8868 RepID=UPI0015D5CF3A|nr:NEDD4-binding protein 2-like 2 isoform X2 [Cygnus atratus]XP_050566212.1 NEDD4-binding protein 2-like 2 isoform X2 [Cygnus atratus]XP_050566216.1 NEDD4-binding protein 2-like 2 isoform X2 [Cygnus atratus]